MLIDDLLSTDAGMDCAVLYVDPPDSPRDEALLKHELQGTQGLVLWVTKELLEADQMPAEYRLARATNIPVLPIAKFDALLSEFTRKEGSWHAISRQDGEYRTKLHAQLEKLFVSREGSPWAQARLMELGQRPTSAVNNVCRLKAYHPSGDARPTALNPLTSPTA